MDCTAQVLYLNQLNSYRVLLNAAGARYIQQEMTINDFSSSFFLY